MFVVSKGALSAMLLLSMFLGFESAGDVINKTKIAQWQVMENQGNTATDLSGNGIEVKLSNVEMFIPTEHLDSHPRFNFKGENSFGVAADTSFLNPERLTVIMWIKPSEDYCKTQKALLLKSAPSTKGTPPHQYGLLVSDTQITFCVGTENGYHQLSVSNKINYNKWTHIAGVYDGTKLSLYLDGKLTAERKDVSGKIIQYNTPLIVGAYANYPKNSTYCYSGCISNIMLFNTGLNKLHIKELYDKDKALYHIQTASQNNSIQSEYEKQLNWALSQWGFNFQ